MLHFENDYNAMCHPKVLERLAQSMDLRQSGYGNDEFTHKCAGLIQQLCGNDNLSVHFLSAGTQTNLITIAAALRPYQGVVAAQTAHISEHEAGAIEACGHKIIEVPAQDGKITAAQVEMIANAHYNALGMSPEHQVQPKLVYISFSTELGTTYTKSELEAFRSVCDCYGMYLYIDGARLGYGLCADDCDVTLSDLARFADAFYIGGTKQGTLYGEALVISNPAIATDFRYMIKQRGGMLAKGWLVALQFMALLDNGLYFELSKQANKFADEIRSFLLQQHFEICVKNRTNQVFAVLPDRILNEINKKISFCDWLRVDDQHRMVRFCTSWSTTEEDLDVFKAEIFYALNGGQ